LGSIHRPGRRPQKWAAASAALVLLGNLDGTDQRGRPDLWSEHVSVDDPSRVPLIVSDDPELLDDLLRLAAAACVEVEVAPDLTGTRSRAWSAAPLVLVGVEQAAACLRARLPRRDGVVLVGRDLGDDTLWTAATALGAEHVVVLPAAEAWVIDRLADAAAGGPGGRGRVVAVVGGRGGAGASVLATALAVTAARLGVRPLLVDADPLGGGLDLVVGGEDADGFRWPDLVGAFGRVSAPALHDALPRVGELCVLSWDRGDLLDVAPEAIDAAVDAGRRGSDLVVVDLPRRPDEAAVRALQAADVVLLVVPAEVRACAAAARVAMAVGPHCADLRVVVRGPAPAGLRSRDLGAALGLPVVGVLRPEPGLAAALERGEAPAARGRGPLAQLCRRLLRELELVDGRSAAA